MESGILVNMKSRPPKNYSGVENLSKKGSELLPNLLHEIGQKMGDRSEEVFAYWYTLLNEAWAPMTKPISLVDGVLTVNVKSSTLYSLLCQHEKGRLLKELQEKFSIRNLTFRVG